MIRAFTLVGILLLTGPGSARAEQTEVDLSSPEAVRKALAHRDAGTRLTAARAAVALQDTSLTAPLVRLLKDKEAPVRLAALDALAAREAEKERKAAAKGIVALLAPLPREPEARDLERESTLVPVLHDLAQPVALEKLLDIHAEAPRELIQARLRAVANTPCAAAVDALIDFGSRARRGHGRRTDAGAALRYATGLDYGKDLEEWRAWWREAKATFDFEAAAQTRVAERLRGDAKDQRRTDKKKRRKGKRERKDAERRRPDAGAEYETARSPRPPRCCGRIYRPRGPLSRFPVDRLGS